MVLALASRILLIQDSRPSKKYGCEKGSAKLNPKKDGVIRSAKKSGVYRISNQEILLYKSLSTCAVPSLIIIDSRLRLGEIFLGFQSESDMRRI